MTLDPVPLGPVPSETVPRIGIIEHLRRARMLGWYTALLPYHNGRGLNRPTNALWVGSLGVPVLPPAQLPFGGRVVDWETVEPEVGKRYNPGVRRR